MKRCGCNKDHEKRSEKNFYSGNQLQGINMQLNEMIKKKFAELLQIYELYFKGIYFI